MMKMLSVNHVLFPLSTAKAPHLRALIDPDLSRSIGSYRDRAFNMTLFFAIDALQLQR
jgi:hypothetical protein